MSALTADVREREPVDQLLGGGDLADIGGQRTHAARSRPRREPLVSAL